MQHALNLDNADLNLYQYTFNPKVKGLAFVGQLQLTGPYFPVLELQARWIAIVFAGHRPLVHPDAMSNQIHQFRELRKLGATLAAVGQTTTPEVQQEQLDLLTMLAQQPNPWPPIAAALTAIKPNQ